MIEEYRYIIIDDDAYCVFKTNEITEELEQKVKEGYYQIIDLETMETIHSNKNGLFRREITEY